MGAIMLAILGLYLLSAAFRYIQQYIMASIAQKFTLSMRKSVSDKMNRLPLRYYDTHKKGDILSRVTSDLERVADTLQEGLTQLLSSVVTIIGAFVMMLRISPMLTLIAFGTIIASLVIAALVATRTHRYYAANQTALGELNANIEESFTGNNIIKAYNLQDEMTATNEQLNEKLFKASKKAQFVTYAINPIIRLVGQLGYVLIAVRGAFSVISGSISIGDIQAMFQYVNQVSEPVTQFAYTMNSLQGAIASAERVYQIQDELEELPDASEEEIIQAAKAARIDYFIRTLPQGYQTVLDDELSGISIGQKQLITIARAILANPSILILDEATSSVDTRTEIEIQKAMNKLMKGRTSFVIAHRLSTIRDADLILVMREGTIVEQGTHGELLKLNGFYAELYNSQFAAKAS
jgi:ABC-type multidrug transport system fused ATPase/permease subunit